KADAQTVDAASMEVAINERRARFGRIHKVRQTPGIFKWVAAAAIFLTVTSGVIPYVVLTPPSANAHAIVTSAHSALREDLDRCYQVELVKLPSARSRVSAFVQIGDKAILW